ncbi:hypothetical protein D3C76_1079030 [compost metagenome]
MHASALTPITRAMSATPTCCAPFTLINRLSSEAATPTDKLMVNCTVAADRLLARLCNSAGTSA